MGIVSWIVLGLIAGLVGNWIMGTGREGVMMDIFLGIIGAIVGGFIFSAVSGAGVTGFNLWSIIVAIIGACIVQWAYRKMTGRTI